MKLLFGFKDDEAKSTKPNAVFCTMTQWKRRNEPRKKKIKYFKSQVKIRQNEMRCDNSEWKKKWLKLKTNQYFPEIDSHFVYYEAKKNESWECVPEVIAKGNSHFTQTISYWFLALQLCHQCSSVGFRCWSCWCCFFFAFRVLFVFYPWLLFHCNLIQCIR